MSASLSCLIVEDQALIAMMLEDFLDLFGHRVIGCCSNVTDALAKMTTERPDLVILDCSLDDNEPGWPVADAAAAAGIPYILASGDSGQECPPAHENAQRLAKPFTADQLEAAIKAVIK